MRVSGRTDAAADGADANAGADAESGGGGVAGGLTIRCGLAEHAFIPYAAGDALLVQVFQQG